jgi:hypothetical protein
MPGLIPSRRLIALLAAYVFALQALLLPLTVAARPILDGSLCASATADGGPQPAGHDSGCACAAGCGMQCHAPALAGPAPIVFDVHRPRVSTTAAAPLIAAVVRRPSRTPLMARAPPSP